MHKSDEDSTRSSRSVDWQPVRLKPRGGTRDAGTNTELRISSRPRNSSTRDFREIFPASEKIHNLPIKYRNGGISNAFSTIDVSSSTKVQLPSNLSYNFSQSLSSIDRPKIVKWTGCAAKPRRPVQRSASRLYRTTSVTGAPTALCVGPEFIVRASQPIRYLSLSSTVTEPKDVIVTLLNGQRINITCDPLNTTAGEIFQLIVKSENYVYEHNFMLGISVLVGGDFIFLPDDYKIRKVSPEGWCNKCNGKSKQHKNEKPSYQPLSFVLFLRIKFFLPANVGKTVATGSLRNRIYLQLRRSIVEGQVTSSIHQLIQLAGFALHIEFGDYSKREHGLGDYFLLEHYLPEVACGQNGAEVKKCMKKAHEMRGGMDKGNATDCFINLAQTFKDYGAHFYSAVWTTQDGFSRNIWLSISPKGIILYSRNTCINALPHETYSANSTHRVLLQSLAWHHIHSLHFNKKALYILLNTKNGFGKSNIKFKLKMGDNKSYFTFWLASLHHRFYVKFHAERDLLDNLCKKNCDPSFERTSINKNERQELIDKNAESECSNYQDSYNMAVRGPPKLQRLKKEIFEFNLPDRRLEEFQNAENERPPSKSKENVEFTINSKTCIFPITDSVSSSESCSLPRRHGVKMGTRVFTGPHNKQTNTIDKTQLTRRSTFSDPTQKTIVYTDRLVQSDIELASGQSDSDDPQSFTQHSTSGHVNGMKLLPSRNYQCMNDHDTTYSNAPKAFAIESPRVYLDNTNICNTTNDDTCINNSLQKKFEMLGCVQGERRYVTAMLNRETSLGMQVAEGSDGNIYIKSITPNGPAWNTKKLIPGDQIISVNGQTLLNFPYQKSLAVLQAAPGQVELLVLQNVNNDLSELSPGRSSDVSYSQNHNKSCDCHSRFCSMTMLKSSDVQKYSKDSTISRTVEPKYSDDKHLEALDAIQALIQLTRDNNVRDKINPWNSLMLQKCVSGNVMYDESGTSHDSSQIAGCGTLQTYPSSNESDIGKYCSSSSHRGTIRARAKHRTLSLHIPADIEVYHHDTDSSILNNSSKAYSCENVTIPERLDSSDETKMLVNMNYSTEQVPQAVGLLRNHGVRRKWVGPMRYPVTPCKTVFQNANGRNNTKIVQRRFAYCENNDEGQLFL